MGIKILREEMSVTATLTNPAISTRRDFYDEYMTESAPYCFQMSLATYMKSKGSFYTVICDVKSACGIYVDATLSIAMQKEIGVYQNFQRCTIKNTIISVQSIRAFLNDDNWGPPYRVDGMASEL